jgi:predicted transport protein
VRRLQPRPAALQAAKPDGLLCFSYPKKTSGLETDLTRDQGWQVISEASYRPVRQVAIDDTWSAVRFRPAGDESPQTPVDAQYRGAKAHLRTLYEKIAVEAQRLDPADELAPRNSYVALQKNKTFALIKASTKDRLDLGLKLPALEGYGRLQDSAGFGSGSITHKVALHSLEDIDEELLGWLRAAYETVA